MAQLIARRPPNNLRADLRSQMSSTDMLNELL